MSAIIILHGNHRMLLGESSENLWKSYVPRISIIFMEVPILYTEYSWKWSIFLGVGQSLSEIVVPGYARRFQNDCYIVSGLWALSRCG